MYMCMYGFSVDYDSIDRALDRDTFLRAGKHIVRYMTCDMYMYMMYVECMIILCELSVPRAIRANRLARQHRPPCA